MAGYLDEYGVKDAQRAKRNRWVVLSILGVLILGGAGYLFFQNWSEKRTVKGFVEALNARDYTDAYKFWQTPEAQKFYPFAKFNEDWGTQGTYRNASAIKVVNIDSCDAGVVFGMSYPGADAFGLWVDRGTDKLSFAPWPRCPGPHLQIMEFLKRKIWRERFLDPTLFLKGVKIRLPKTYQSDEFKSVIRFPMSFSFPL